jgi:hypothetical protein
VSTVATKDYIDEVPAWIGVDLDRTLAKYTHWVAADDIGDPIPSMVDRVKLWLAHGLAVRIFTARVWHNNSVAMFERSELARTAIQRWCRQHIGVELPITCVKDLGCVALYDDIAIQVVPNTGIVLQECMTWYNTKLPAGTAQVAITEISKHD